MVCSKTCEYVVDDTHKLISKEQGCTMPASDQLYRNYFGNFTQIMQ